MGERHLLDQALGPFFANIGEIGRKTLANRNNFEGHAPHFA